MQVEQKAKPKWLHPEVRKRKAHKILAVLDDFLGGDLCSLRCLDIGCSQGVIAHELANRFGLVAGVDVDKEAIEGAINLLKTDSTAFLEASGMALPFVDECFDVVICAQVYEHVNDASALFSEIYRVLEKNGICFFSGPNKLAPIEAHYSLPLVHWLPRIMAGAYLRAFGRGKFYLEKPLFYWELKGAMRKFKIIDYTTRLIKEPGAFYCEEEVKPRWLCGVPSGVLERLIFAFPNYNWILQKRTFAGTEDEEV